VWDGTSTLLYRSALKTGSAGATSVSVSLAGVSVVRLVVTDGGDGNAYDHGDWGDAKLVCGGGGVDTTPPSISSIGAVPSSSGAIVSWVTDEAADSRVEYGTTVSYGSSSVLDTTKVLSHSVTLSGLTAGTLYHYRVRSADGAGNLAVSADQTFTTGVSGGGPQTVFLSGLSPTVAPVNGWGPVEMDESNGEASGGDGGPLTLAGVVFAKGLGTHAASDVRFTVPAGCSSFAAKVGVDDEVGANGSVVFQVFVDGVSGYTSGVMTGSSATKSVSVPVSGGAVLRLVVDPNGSNAYDHADWADAQLTCGT
jgi:NPCBM/NEW2 domain/Purple acid Phosphatase, N-terminal domain